MSELRRRGPKGLLLLNLSAWIRQRSGLGVLYRKLPLSWRVGAARLLSAPSAESVRFQRTPAWERLSHSAGAGPVAPMRAAAGPGVNILGYVRGQFGLGESLRMYARALIEAGVPVRLFDIDLGLPHGWDEHSLDAWVGDDLPYPVSIIFVNPDYLERALELVGVERLSGKHLIACWFWELERVPDAWLPAIAQVDEIMVASRFIEGAFSKATGKPILRVPQPLSAIGDSGLQRADFGLEEGKFIFLITFDFNSWVERKNPYAAIAAFKRAFPKDRDDVRLLVKSSNGHRYQDWFRRLLNEAATDPRIIVRDEVIERPHVYALQRCCDAYVSLHRAEGFGLGLAECMAMGKPVIATAWSGNMDFMEAGNAMLVGYRLVPVREGEYPHEPGDVWAEPDVEEAAAFMRTLADDPVRARELGQRAAESVCTLLSPQRAVSAIDVRLRELAAGPAIHSHYDTGTSCHH
ncbi:glycosyltransferase involved in cell wall biosynthesis [Xanthomonas sacchari]|uniref:glycosyltransferase family 4 protein n=1 Tax=Xanthomonas sacchari TaxID=56458 RepID=UPI00278250FC|nr:glycosyltransferase family 4 protein [Xanthomonas sacchari]MDQ1094686.1 glycosyltransferase involved in cell wall biosynthesis [Xanthomonas sacchari]